MNRFEKILKTFVILVALEIPILSFATIQGFENGFKLWNWVVIGIGILAYAIAVIGAILWENKTQNKVKVPKEQLIVNGFYQEQAKRILNVLDNYLKENDKVATDLRLYWPFYKGILTRIARGKKMHGDDYGILERLNDWQKENYEDSFLMNLYDVLKNNII